MAYTMHMLLLTFGALSMGAAYHGPDLPPGPYCRQNGVPQCCDNRRDSCSHRILNTLCYCDQFCKRAGFLDDCCPDYEEVCLGQVPPPNIIRGNCGLGQKKTTKCNECKCEMVSGKPDWVCERDTCLISDDVIYGVNQGGSTWRAANYSQYYTKKLKEGLVYRLGTLPLSAETRRMNPVRYDKDIDYPTNFDARRKWPNFISAILDQGWCGSDWAVSIAGVASDRFAIQSNGAENLLLSAQGLLSCVRGQRGCDGGHIDAGWNFAKNFGLVDNDCLPYTASKTRCPLKKRSTLREDGCLPLNPIRTSRYKVSPTIRLSEEKDIMYEIMDAGPVQAIMTVYQDFFHYHDGIYRRTQYGDTKLQGLHSVRIVGWGEDRRDKYWIVANSWGTEWGENGFFRIARGHNESGIESFVVSVLSDVNESNQKK